MKCVPDTKDEGILIIYGKGENEGKNMSEWMRGKREESNKGKYIVDCKN